MQEEYICTVTNVNAKNTYVQWLTLMQEEYICTVTNVNARRIHMHSD